MNRTFKTLALLVFSTLLFAQCNQQNENELRIRGKLTGVKDSLLFSIRTFEKGEVVFRDTTINTNNGEFDFTLRLDSVGSMEVIDGAFDREGRYVGFYTIAVPGEEMVIEGDIAEGCRFSGSKFYRDLDEVEQFLQPINREFEALTQSYDSLAEADKVTDEVEQEYGERELQLYRKRENMALAFAKAHPDMEANVAFENYIDTDVFKKLVKLLNPSVINGRMKSYILPRINMPAEEPVPYKE